MTLDDLIKTASANRPLELAEVEATARELRLSVPELLDLFARTVAIRCLRGDYPYKFGDLAMNQLYGFAYMDNDLGLPSFAWEVFRAFDEGEYTHDGMAAEQQGEALTRELLCRIHSLRGL